MAPPRRGRRPPRRPPGTPEASLSMEAPTRINRMAFQRTPGAWNRRGEMEIGSSFDRSEAQRAVLAEPRAQPWVGGPSARESCGLKGRPRLQHFADLQLRHRAPTGLNHILD